MCSMDKRNLTSPTSSDNFANRLRVLRKSKNLSQQQLAEIIGIHYLQLGRYERDQSKPSAKRLQGLAEALDTTTDFLLEGETGDLAADRLRDEQLLRHFQAIEELPEPRKEIVKELLASFIRGEKVMELTAS